jgi:4-hydroxy-L-threonine phosphate dehydrogenase PdxA
MMLASEELKIVPVSIHEALAAAVRGLSTRKIVDVAQAAASGLSRGFGIRNPRLAIAGLNPHASEGGSMGRQEIETIAPAIEILKREGIDVSGPYPPDTMFTPRAPPNLRRGNLHVSRPGLDSAEDAGRRRRGSTLPSACHSCARPRTTVRRWTSPGVG